MRLRRLEGVAAVAALVVGFTLPLDGQGREDLVRLVGQTVSGKTVSVADGDTVRIRLDGTGRVIRVRLEGIDAPEIGEPFSNQARNAARVLMFDRKVQVKAADVDNYDRLVARVIVDGTDSSVELLRAGLACHFTRFENDAVLAQAQLDARTSGKGFWAAGAPKPRCVSFTRRPAPSRRK
jgi:micrococcal nuclease